MIEEIIQKYLKKEEKKPVNEGQSKYLPLIRQMIKKYEKDLEYLKDK
jgi:hypothetical protein